MKLIFKNDFDQPLELTLASSRYAIYWQKHNQEIINSFYRHTSLYFKQRAITVRTWDENKSRAGNLNRPMMLTTKEFDEVAIGATIIHELAHRLIIGNGIEPGDKTEASRQRANYHMHRQIDLFLYDVLKDVLGKEEADKVVTIEKSASASYRKAWNWALSMNYEERQKKIASLKSRKTKS